jgi:23S rRNA (pseudouridine1915-N3)-methyltransferase
MKLHLAWIGKTKEQAIAALTTEYIKRIQRYIPTEQHEFKNEAALLEFVEKKKIRPTLVLMDERGVHLSSLDFSKFISKHQDRGTQVLLFAIGPSDGFCDETRKSAASMLSLGKMVLAHELARVVLLEQVYRAFTILAGHPYHRGEKA